MHVARTGSDGTARAAVAACHDISLFSLGIPTLDAWLRGNATLSGAKGGARTNFVCDGNRMAGFCGLGGSAMEQRRVSPLWDNMRWTKPARSRRLGSRLVVDAVRRSLAAAGVVVVQSVDERARTFHERRGFRPHSDREPLTPVLRMSEIAGLLKPRGSSAALRLERAGRLHCQVLDGQHAGKGLQRPLDLR
ncbi:MAG: hypothetical protein F4X97_04310 [Boseongicola sp. SB0662_bin_57]|nr:hypothetical protein [Boseongicola sp. SB0662_bin_57]MYH58160.1 hypothetical protein [Boseongicola sp. SB0675_bin_26]